MLCPISDDIIEQNKKLFLTLILSIWVVNIVQSDCSPSHSPQSRRKSFHLRARDQTESTAARAVLSAPFLLPKHKFLVPHPAEKPENHTVYASFRA